jgi:hypothetical protein
MRFLRRVLLATVASASLYSPALPGGPGAKPTQQDPLQFWAFREPVRPAVPGPESPAPLTEAQKSFWARHAGRIKNPIDAFILDKDREKGLTPAPPADRHTLLRRACFDLLGLPPTPEQVARFVSDPAPDAYPLLINELLRSPHYGERWARHWLDVARYADSGGYETDIYYKNAWRYRDYVVKAFNDDRPYDRFVQEQIAGDELWPDNLDLAGSYKLDPAKRQHLEARIGTGLFALGPQIHESNMDAPKIVHERLTDWVDTTGSVFLGLTLGCARCHDHKLDPITQQDYYALQAVFAGSKEVEEPLIDAMGVADFKQFYPKILAVDEARTAYRLLEKKLQGRSPTAQEQQHRKQLLEDLARAVLALPEATAQGHRFDGIMEIPTATVLAHGRPELVPAVYVLKRGELGRKKAKATPALPAVLARATGRKAALPGPFGGRKELALWLTRPDHPLTARVMANRLWQWHFGRGLVATPNDFGKMGQPPTHPELLDWLATEFVSHGWSIKHLHRLIMLSSTYQQSSRFGDAEDLRRDPDNRLLWRMSRRRLEGEALWDAVHAAAGTLNLKMGGRPVVPPLAEDELSPLRDRWQWTVTADPSEHTRRGLYLLVRRNFRFPMLEAFDAPVSSVSCPCRDVTTVAPQALWLLNNHVVQRQAQHFAARLGREAGDKQGRWIERAWQIALGRPPSAAEQHSALNLLEKLAQSKSATKGVTDAPPELTRLPPAQAAALVRLCLAVYNLNEFAFVD